MDEPVGYAITGMEELLGKLQTVQDDIQRKGGRHALRKASQLIRDRARDNASHLDDPETASNISKNIVERWNGRVFRTSGDLAFRIGVLGGAKGFAAASGEIQGKGKGNPGGDTFYWRFLEFGTSEMAPRPFMRRALADNIAAATNEFVSQYDKALDRAIQRAARAKAK